MLDEKLYSLLPLGAHNVTDFSYSFTITSTEVRYTLIWYIFIRNYAVNNSLLLPEGGFFAILWPSNAIIVAPL